jgi:hypothetical protein
MCIPMGAVFGLFLLESDFMFVLDRLGSAIAPACP